jgi:hypothetical protein
LTTATFTWAEAIWLAATKAEQTNNGLSSVAKDMKQLLKFGY